MHARVNKLNPHANTLAAVKMNEINPKYENTSAINQSKSRILILGVIIAIIYYALACIKPLNSFGIFFYVSNSKI
jgi:hypothetical protein